VVYAKSREPTDDIPQAAGVHGQGGASRQWGQGPGHQRFWTNSSLGAEIRDIRAHMHSAQHKNLSV